MEIGKDFSTWFKDRVSQYDFTENVDFVLLPNSGEYSGRGQPPKEYAISLDMAKGSSLAERNRKVKQVGGYCMVCERGGQMVRAELSIRARGQLKMADFKLTELHRWKEEQIERLGHKADSR